MSVVRLVVVSAAAVRVRGLVAGGCGLINGRRAAAAARRERPEHLLLAVQLWRNGATLHRHQCCLPAGIGACSHDELADRAARDAARLAGRVECQAQRPWWPMWTARIVLAAAGLEESAAYGTGLRVLHVENGLLEILNSRCDTYGGCPGDVTSFFLRCQGELLGLWDPQNRDLRRKLPPETKFLVG